MGCNPTWRRDRSGRGLSGAGEVYETALNVGVDEFDANVVAHVETLDPRSSRPSVGGWKAGPTCLCPLRR